MSKKSKKSITPFGNLMLELEQVLEAMIDEHDVQRYEICALVDAWVRVHRPESVETYLDSTQPNLEDFIEGSRQNQQVRSE